MSLLLSMDTPVAAECSTVTLLSESNLSLVSSRIAELLETVGERVITQLPEAGAARCESAATLRVIWITDDHCVSAFQSLCKLLQQSGSSRISICMILAGGAFRSPEQRGDAQRRMQAELAAAGAGEILQLDCGLLTVDDSQVPEQLRLPRWLAPLLPASATLPCLTAERLVQVLAGEFLGETTQRVGQFRRLTIPGRRSSLRQLLSLQKRRSGLSHTMTAIAALAARFGGTLLADLTLRLLCRIGWSWARLLPQTVKPRSARELLEIYNRWSWPDLQLAGWNNGVVHFGWKFPGRTVVSTSASGRCLRPGTESVTVDGGLPLKQVLLALQKVGRSLPVVPNFSWISMGTAFFVPVHGSGCRVSTLGQTVVRALVYDAAENRLLRLHRRDSEFRRMMYDRSRPLLLLRMTLQTQQPLKYSVREETLQNPTAEKLLQAFADPEAANVELRKARAVDREVIVRRFDAEPAITGAGDLPRDRLGSLWDRIEETPLVGTLFHWFVRTFAFHVELLMTPDEFRIFWKHHTRLPLAKIQLRRMLRDGIENSACCNFDCICADLFMLRGKRHVFTEFITEHLPTVRTNPGKQSL
ncbi:MAG TPA: hypothetical protein DIT89_04365 [Planctomycetaceae bacterium]|nr:hypothetical protein [Planctomycetaceae bacterium]